MGTTAIIHTMVTITATMAITVTIMERDQLNPPPWPDITMDITHITMDTVTTDTDTDIIIKGPQNTIANPHVENEKFYGEFLISCLFIFHFKFTYLNLSFIIKISHFKK